MFETVCESVRRFVLVAFSKKTVSVTNEKAKITAAFKPVWVQTAKKGDYRYALFKMQIF